MHSCLVFRRRHAAATKGNTAQRASGNFARHLLANFPSEPVSYLVAQSLCGIALKNFFQYWNIFQRPNTQERTEKRSNGKCQDHKKSAMHIGIPFPDHKHQFQKQHVYQINTERTLIDLM